MEAALIHAGGQIVRHEITGAFRDYANAPENYSSQNLSITVFLLRHLDIRSGEVSAETRSRTGRSGV